MRADMSRKNDLGELIVGHTRRLQKLCEQKAAYGLATEPHVLVEIEDIETEIGKLQEELAAWSELSHLSPYRGLSAFRWVRLD
jgi:hypothetical protein